MEIGLLQLFWLVLIMAIFIASAIKRYLRNRKAQNKLSNVNVREREELKRRRAQDQKSKSGWEDFMSDMFGVEPIEIRTRRPQSEDRRKPRHKEIKKKEKVKTEILEVEAVESGINEFHSSIEDRHIESQLNENVLQSAIAKPQIVSSVESKAKEEYKHQKMQKEYSPIAHSIFRKNGFKEAIIFSEIIGTPVALRKKSRFKRIR